MNSGQMLLELTAAPLPTFDNFVPGRNAAALAVLRALGSPAASDRCVYLWGVPGSGRSHLLAAWQAVQATNPGCHVVDDVGTLGESAQSDLFNRYNHARDGHAWLLVAGDRPPTQLLLRDDVRSRLAWGLTFEIMPLTDDEKHAALTQRASERGMRINGEMLDYLMTRSRRDMTSLIALLEALDRLSLQTKRPLTVPLLRELLTQNQSLPL